MQPVPCAHCGNNFMRQTLDPEAPRLCNSCKLREDKRNPQKEDNMTTIDIVITVPREDHIAIEEHCINQGMDLSRYFLELHHGMKAMKEEMIKVSTHPRPVLMGKMEEVEEEETKTPKKGGKK